MLARLSSQYSSAVSRKASQYVPSLMMFQKRAMPVYPSTSVYRYYSDDHHGLTQEEVTARVIDVIKAFNKVDPNAVTATSNFQKDLGLDSLETVELLLNIEDDFSIEIPEAEAEKINSAEDAINFIVAHPHAK